MRLLKVCPFRSLRKFKHFILVTNIDGFTQRNSSPFLVRQVVTWQTVEALLCDSVIEAQRRRYNFFNIFYMFEASEKKRVNHWMPVTENWKSISEFFRAATGRTPSQIKLDRKQFVLQGRSISESFTLKRNTYYCMSLFLLSFRDRSVGYKLHIYSFCSYPLNYLCLYILSLAIQHVLEIETILTLRLLMSYIWSTYSWCF